jgi:pimeloyl-ACP methyl ester carboxylesterase
MRLILVHGINQEGRSEDLIKTEWLDALEAGLGLSGTTKGLDVRAPFYGDTLAQASGPRFSGVVAQGASADTDETAFLAAALSEQAQAAGAGGRAIAAEERALAQEAGGDVAAQAGFLMDRRLNAILRVIERLSPLHGDVCMSLLKQAYAYLKRPGVNNVVDAIVRPVLDAGPAVVVGHSLGTVVTFKLLRQLALEGRPIRVPLYVTMGSPLPLMAVQAALGPAFVIPSGVDQWLNAVDPDDLIALGRGLDAANFTAGIENLSDIRNIPGDPHSIRGYIGDNRIGGAILSACHA